MPAQTQDKMKATSPSPNIQRGVDQAWGAQTGFKTPQQALAKKWNKNPVKVGGGK